METFPRYWPFVPGIRRSLVNSPHKGKWHGTLMFSLLCAWTNGWVNTLNAGDLRHHRTHCDVAVMYQCIFLWNHDFIVDYYVIHDVDNTLNPASGVVTVCHQVCCMYWGIWGVECVGVGCGCGWWWCGGDGVVELRVGWMVSTDDVIGHHQTS